MMKVPQGGNLGGAANLYDLWTSNITVESDTNNALDVHPGTTYKSEDMLDWDNLTIRLVGNIEDIKQVVISYEIYEASLWQVS